MRIAFIITALANQGSISVFKELINQLTLQGIALDLFYFDEKIENNFDCKKYRISFTSSLKDYNYDVVHSTGIRPDLYVWLNKKKFPKKTKFITTIHSFIRKDFNNEYNWLVSAIASNLWYRIMSAHDRVAVLTNDAKLYYSKLLSSPIHVVNNGRTCISNNDIASEDEVLLREIALKYKILGTHAKISKIKGLNLVIDALVKLTDYAFVVIGQGKELDALKAQALRLGVNDRCFFLGFRTNITPFFRFYDIYVMPSLSEGLPMALIEAVANKVVCLCSDISTFKEIFSEDEVLKFELGDVDDFIEKVSMLEDKRLKEQMIVLAHEKYLSSYTAEVMASNYLKLYREMCATNEKELPYSQAEFIRMIHLINRKYKEDTTDSMLFTPIVENIISKVGSENVCIWAQSPGADVDLGSRPAFKLLVDAARKINRGDTIFVTSTPPHFVFMILMIRCFRNFKIIFQVQDLYPDILKILDWRFKVLYYLTIIPSYFFYKLVDVFLTISDEIKDHLIKQYNISGEDIFVEENWTDIECVNLFEKPMANRIVYIGNIGRAHDYNYFLKYIMTEPVTTEVVIKTDNSSKIKLSNSDKIDANGLKQGNLPPFIKWNHTRYSKDELSEFLSGFDYSIVFLGKDFDKILFPCKIYSSLAMLMPVIFFGPKDSFVNIWLEKYNLGFHYKSVKENYKNLDFYRKNIYRYNKENPIEKKIEYITQIILK